MAVRLLEMKRILKPTGSIYLHCDPTMSHYLKLVMDSIFGRKQFKREIIWNLQTASGFKSQVVGYVRGHDTLIYYVRGAEYTFNKQFLAHKPEYVARFRKTDEDGRRFRDDRPGGRRQYLDDTFGVMLTDVWSDIMSFQQASTSGELVGYPTQKPLALLERIVKASSNENDVVLDPFCGCATTCVAADALNRKWVGIDISRKAYELVRERIDDLTRTIISRDDIPRRTDLGKLPPYNSLEVRKSLYGEQEGNCNGCKTHFQLRNLTVDHIIARSKGGTDHIENLQLLCGHCNSVKGDRGQEYLIAKLLA